MQDKISMQMALMVVGLLTILSDLNVQGAKITDAEMEKIFGQLFPANEKLPTTEKEATEFCDKKSDLFDQYGTKIIAYGSQKLNRTLPTGAIIGLRGAAAPFCDEDTRVENFKKLKQIEPKLKDLARQTAYHLADIQPVLKNVGQFLCTINVAKEKGSKLVKGQSDELAEVVDASNTLYDILIQMVKDEFKKRIDATCPFKKGAKPKTKTNIQVIVKILELIGGFNADQAKTKKG